MGGLVNALEFGILYRKFDVKVGGRNDVNYIAFCEMIDDYAQTKWSDPAQGRRNRPGRPGNCRTNIFGVSYCYSNRFRLQA